MTNDSPQEPHHATSPTGHILEELALYGHRPFDDEPNPRPLSSEAAARHVGLTMPRVAFRDRRCRIKPRRMSVAGWIAPSNAIPNQG